MFKNKLGEDSPISKFKHLQIRCRDGIKSLRTLEEGEFKVPIDGCIRKVKKREKPVLHTRKSTNNSISNSVYGNVKVY